MIMKEKHMGEPELPPRSQAKREAIHVAAQELFTRQGFEGTSMDAIAEAAHVSKQTLYRYYENKEALFVATLRRQRGPPYSRNSDRASASRRALPRQWHPCWFPQIPVV